MIALPVLIALAQTPATTATPAPTPAPPPAFSAAAQAFGQCLGRGVSALPASVAAAPGAQQVVAGCAAERAAVDTQFEAWIGGAGFSAAGRDEARGQYRQRMDGIPAQLTTALARRAAVPAPGATPTPNGR